MGKSTKSLEYVQHIKYFLFLQLNIQTEDMVNYEDFSREQLIARIKELEDQAGQIQEPLQKIPLCCALSSPENISTEFQENHGTQILNALPDMLSVFDYQGTYVALASAEETVHVGDSSANLIGKNLIDILPPNEYDGVKKNFDKAISTGKASSAFHNLYVHGILEHFENRFIPLDNKYILCICRNISDRVKAQNELQMIKYAVNNSIDEIYAATPNGTLIFANKQFIGHYQLDRQISQYTIFDVYPDINTENWQEHIEDMREKGGALKYNATHNLHGKIIHQEISAYLFKDSQNNEVIWTFTRDITEKIEQETKIHELNSLMDTILNNVPAYLFVKDSGNDFRYLYWNKAFEHFSKIPASKAIGHTDNEIFPNSEDAQKFQKNDLELLKTRGTVELQEEYTTLSGEQRIVNTIKTILPLKGKSPLLLGISWDITDLKKAEEALMQAKIKAEESDKLKSAFLANMSHEIRTPLNAIVGFSKLLADTENEEERQQFYDIVDKNSDLLLQLINDILDLSKIEAGILEFTRHPVNLTELCQGLFNTHLARMPKNVKLIYEKPDNEFIILSDSNRIAQVISNLLTNAQKFTKNGEIRFGFQQEGDNIRFFVKDTGIGIPKVNHDKIFNRFVKLNNFIQGTGLGLPICDMIVRNLGGKIWVESEENKGSLFQFIIPVTLVYSSRQPQTTGKTTIPIEKNGQGKTILVAEDVDSNYLLLKTLIGKEYNLHRANNGYEAVELSKTISPDLILMDIKMPEMDGLEATQAIRRYSKSIPIIALTAFAFENDKEAALVAGCNDFLTKPFTKAALINLLKKYI